MTFVFPNSAYADPAAEFTAPVLKTANEKHFSSSKLNKKISFLHNPWMIIDYLCEWYMQTDKKK
jgi:hypothetical protein